MHIQHTRMYVGRTWAMAESIEPGELDAVNSTSPLPPSIVTQHAFTPRKFILLSTEVLLPHKHTCTVHVYTCIFVYVSVMYSKGSYILTKPRPVDQLRVLLGNHKTGCCEPIEAFFHLHGDAQACAMCLILATGPNKEVSWDMYTCCHYIISLLRVHACLLLLLYLSWYFTCT